MEQERPILMVDILIVVLSLNPVGKNPVILQRFQNYNTRIMSSGFSFAATSKVEKGDYLKLKNIQFAYNVPLQNVKLQGKISSARVYVQAVNLYTLTKYRGSDPEISINGNSIHSGKDQNVPPNAQVFSAGVQVGF
ncbi:MAG: hypothetical protein IPM86_06550 [Saprospiraceae bacterium]|nr:hypothetical protein [Saprospiraceae bacterium]